MQGSIFLKRYNDRYFGRKGDNQYYKFDLYRFARRFPRIPMPMYAILLKNFTFYHDDFRNLVNREIDPKSFNYPDDYTALKCCYKDKRCRCRNGWLTHL